MQLKKILFMVVLLISFSLKAQTFENPVKNGALKVSVNQRFLVHENGKPFFWLGDTAWELFHRLNREDAEKYLKSRAENGFTVIQAVALAEINGLHTPNPYGHIPLKNDDPTQPNEDYFQHVDFVIDKAAEYGLFIGFLPTWGDKIFKDRWGAGPEIFNAENIKIYGKWLGNRYKNRKNILWIMGGDRNPRNEKDTQIWRALASGVEEGVGDAENALITFHPQPNEVKDGGSAKWFHQDKWLDFNMFQTGHCRENNVWDRISVAYNLTPTKPVLDGEPIYEDHPVCFNAKDLGISNAYDVRRSAYFDVFAGAFGHTYGCHDIWQMYAQGREAINGAHIYWLEALQLPGALQMKFLRKLIESRPMLERVPDQSLLVDALSVSNHIQATRGKDYALIYSSQGGSFSVNLAKISGKTLKTYWLNPRNGEIKIGESIDNKCVTQFSAPSAGYGQDWVLILDDASKNYGF